MVRQGRDLFELCSDVGGTAYERLIDYAMERADTFMLGEDLCFQNTEGEDWIINIAHERIGRRRLNGMENGLYRLEFGIVL